jgi:putative transposase
MSTRFYDTDLTDAAWAWVAPVLPAARPGGRPRTTNLRAILNAIFYLLRTGCQWRLLPREFPPFGTVYHYFQAWQNSGVWVHLHRVLYEQAPKIRESRVEALRERRKAEHLQREAERAQLIYLNLRDFSQLTGDKYQTIGALMESPEGVALRNLWTGELAIKYSRFTDFIASPEGIAWRSHYGLEAGHR